MTGDSSDVIRVTKSRFFEFAENWDRYIIISAEHVVVSFLRKNKEKTLDG